MRTTKHLLITLIVAALFAAACTSSVQQDQQEEVKESMASSKTSEAVSLKDDQLNAIYPYYQHLTAALIEADATEAKVAAAAIELGAKEIPDAGSISSQASKIAATNDIEAQRIEFAALSTNFIALLKKGGMGGGELYIAHCPMASNDKGADWVTNSREIKNPYFGESMLTCGTIKETLK
ncbi:hypothetical protein DBR11_13100 [Pedobacter sp. HMWF019]|uniref:DUF3347 domain-containing protein n=1 Tax=Pedobacter sp. HMWF019 TaxID=2056856 RepID=UPI000D363E2F|nr:DUF3347 domain-containing protein [Pedobacter sp. HMWF019]PTS99156.1 hypothetical protein DBR11_13100 [Pedobacter sp. HMWF019]